ncbi:MAG TPA: hypothetical protein VL307_19270 [Chitinophagaceae bacterium]|nr:hypothetical protein [Chitinophagaceae bacterium]
MKTLLVAGLAMIVLIACNKDKFQTKPHIDLKSLSTKVVPVGGNLVVTLSYTDKEGDISDTLFFKKERLNQRKVATLRDSISYKIPDFPNYDKGEIGLALRYEDHLKSASAAPSIPGSNPPAKESDTLNIRIWIHDKAGNVSDTVSTGQIVVQRVD